MRGKFIVFQLVVVKKLTSSPWTEPNRNPGDIVWVNTEEAARHLIENGLCEWPKSAPREVKPMEPSERKSSGDRTGGPLTDSPSSSERGPEKLSSASAAVLVSPERL